MSADSKMEGCGCAGRPRRLCDLCDAQRGRVFLACSRACLERHLESRHGSAGKATAGERARAAVAALNRERSDAAAPYEGHRTRLTKLVRAVARGEGLAVLGAGNGDDLDLPALLRELGEVHLVDLDGAALERARARAVGAGLSASAAARIVAHAGVDLSGSLAKLDAWGEAFPADGELATHARDTAAGIAAAVGRTFDVVLSGCVLSQLPACAQRALVTTMPDWERLFAGMARAHLLTMARLLREGGTGVLAMDVVSSNEAPELLRFAGAGAPELGPALEPRIRSGAVRANPDPFKLLALCEERELGALVEAPRLTEPWLWELGAGVVQLVYALVFRRA